MLFLCNAILLIKWKLNTGVRLNVRESTNKNIKKSKIYNKRTSKRESYI